VGSATFGSGTSRSSIVLSPVSKAAFIPYSFVRPGGFKTGALSIYQQPVCDKRAGAGRRLTEDQRRSLLTFRNVRTAARMSLDALAGKTP